MIREEEITLEKWFMILDLRWSACWKLNYLTYLIVTWLPFLVVSSLSLFSGQHSEQEGGARAFLLLGEMDHSLSTTISSTAIQFQFFSAAVMDPHGG